ncbi:hypothetical protein PIB30_045723 [Stylosanthes scabra]|uniref:Uncharacterized protein n=1 Tax=Stylosanthes scabra TaxID=79078 RepID=A0ABU6XH44_9FABA|nr:hypothetical protein [Stylosanthes scabra]
MVSQLSTVMVSTKAICTAFREIDRIDSEKRMIIQKPIGSDPSDHIHRYHKSEEFSTQNRFPEPLAGKSYRVAGIHRFTHDLTEPTGLTRPKSD